MVRDSYCVRFEVEPYSAYVGYLVPELVTADVSAWVMDVHVFISVRFCCGCGACYKELSFEHVCYWCCLLYYCFGAFVYG